MPTIANLVILVDAGRSACKCFFASHGLTFVRVLPLTNRQQGHFGAVYESMTAARCTPIERK